MKLALRPLTLVSSLLLAALCEPVSAVAANPCITRTASTLTAFDEGKADGNAYRISVEHNPTGNELITQQVQAAQSAAVANPAAALYFQGYITGLQPNRELTTLVQPQP